MEKQPEDCVSDYYKRQAYELTYGPVISPINGQNKWPTTDDVEIQPPKYKRGPGRPKKLRRREPDEGQESVRIRRQWTSNKCGSCNEAVHNSKTCEVRKV